MHKFYGFVWEKDKGERAAEQKTLQSHSNLAKYSSPSLEEPPSPKLQSSCQFPTAISSSPWLDAPPPVMALEGCLPQAQHLRSFMLPADQGHMLSHSHRPVTVLNHPSSNETHIPHSSPTNNWPKPLRLLQLPSLLLCELVQRYFHTHKYQNRLVKNNSLPHASEARPATQTCICQITLEQPLTPPQKITSPCQEET